MRSHLNSDRVRSSQGFTLVELLVVIAIIGVLVALLLPAVQAAREAARNAQCKNNVKQIALAMINFESAHKKFPSGGWGFRWMGDPDRGVGKAQPGGWVYQTAPYFEAGNITTLGAGITNYNDKRVALAEQRSVTIPSFNCPSRRATARLESFEFCYNADFPDEGDAKTDYAASGGPAAAQSGGPGPDCLETYPNCQWDPSDEVIAASFRGIVASRTGAELRNITDGTSNTLIAGEKWVHSQFYDTVSMRSNNSRGDFNAANDNPGDNSSIWQGFDQDTVRFPSGNLLPVPDTEHFGDDRKAQAGAKYMGSAHPAGINVAYVDGSTHGITFDVDPDVWDALSNREDGKAFGN